jgi:hypothetical protein
MADRAVSVDKIVQINPQTGWVQGWVTATGENRHLGRIEFSARNWEELDIVIGALQKVASGYSHPVLGPDGQPRI